MPQTKTSPRGPDLSFSAAELSIRQMLANGKAKAALDRAKDVHKTHATPASESLLLDAYTARVQALIQQDLIVEAHSLMDLLRDRYPSAAGRLAALVTAIAVQSGNLADMVGSLDDPSLPPEQRATIEQAIERNVYDLGALATCGALSPDHPLRKAAAQLQRAFIAATTGPVSDGDLALPDISRRSPLASWKMLVLAIANFYRGNDESCRLHLAAIKPDSAAARCVPAIQAMLDGKAPSNLKGPAAELVSQVAGDVASLRQAVEKLDRAFSDDETRHVLKAIRPAIDACRRTKPELLVRFKQHISVRCALNDIDLEQVLAALGGPTHHDAYFYQLYASGSEQSGDPADDVVACNLWDQFRQAAIDEGWFPPNGPEVAALYLHIAKLVQRAPAALIRSFERAAKKNADATVENLYFLDPQQLYRRACLADPAYEGFQQWLAWARKRGVTQADSVAETWHKMRSGDLEPVLHLMESFESRNAFPTALEYLNEAENIDSVSTEVRRARMRLMSRSVIRYIQQKRPDLAAKRLDELDALPQSRQGDRPPFLMALRYAAAAVNRDPARLQTIRARLEGMLESPAAAALLIFAALNLCKSSEPILEIRKTSKEDRAALPSTFARLMSLSRDMQFDIRMPQTWMREVANQFDKSKRSLSVTQLLEIGRGGLDTQYSDLAYKASAQGLEAEDATHGQFLILRAKALPSGQFERRMVCAMAAAALARQHGDLELANKAVDLLTGPFKDGSIKVTLQQAAEVVQSERKKPRPHDPPPNYGSIIGGNFCGCPECRRARGESAIPFDLDDGDFDDDPFDDDPFDEDAFDQDAPFGALDFPADMPPAIAALILKETKKAVMSGESLEDLMARLIGMGLPPPPGYSKKGRKGGRK